MAARPGSEPEIFLSYSREDAARARCFAEAFEAEGLCVWWDADLRSGEAYDRVTEHALRSAKAVVVLWSKKSVDSRWVRAEATIADRKQTLVPAMIEPCERPVMFELTQTADLCHWTGDVGDRVFQVFLADVRRFVDGEVAAHAPPAVPSVGGVPSLALLPVECRSAAQDDAFYAHALIEDLVPSLSMNGYFRVIATGSAAALGERAADPRLIGRELGARYVVESHFRRFGGSMRISFQLVDVGTGNVLATLKYSPRAETTHEAHDDLVNEIASDIADQILRNEFARAMGKASDHTAWEHVLRSMASFAHMGLEGGLHGVAEARKATEIAPDFGLAHALVAAGLGTAMFISGRDDPAARREIRMRVARALDLDGEDPHVLTVVSGAERCVGNLEAAVRWAERAVELAPVMSIAYYHLGSSYLALGRTEDALAAFETEERLARHGTPVRYLSVYLHALALFTQGKVAEADAVLERSLRLKPNFPLSLKWKAVIATVLEKPAEASDAVRRLREIDPSATLEQHEAQTLWILPDKELCARANVLLRQAWTATPFEVAPE